MIIDLQPMEQKIRVPKKYQREGAVIILRGEDVWWSTGSLMVKGAPPPGVPILSHVQRLSFDYGPKGSPVQVIPGNLIAGGGVEMTNPAIDASVAILNKRDQRFLMYLSPLPLIYLAYPAKENEHEVIAAYQVDAPGPSMVDFLMGAQPDPSPTWQVRDLFALIVPMMMRPNYFIDRDQIALLPRMSGIERPDKGGA